MPTWYLNVNVSSDNVRQCFVHHLMLFSVSCHIADIVSFPKSLNFDTNCFCFQSFKTDSHVQRFHHVSLIINICYEQYKLIFQNRISIGIKTAYDSLFISWTAHRKWQRGSDLDTCCIMRIKDPLTPYHEHRLLCVCVPFDYVHLCVFLGCSSVCLFISHLRVFVCMCFCVCVCVCVLLGVLKRCFLVKSCSLGVEGEQTGEMLPR